MLRWHAKSRPRTRGHFLMDAIEAPDNPRFPRGAKTFWKTYLYHLDADGVVVAYKRGEIVGFFRYARGARSRIWAVGTWVCPSQRGKGLALKMWRLALARERPRVVEVATVSRGGHGLVSKLKELHPDILWHEK